MLFWMFFRQHVYRSDEVYLLVGDVVATKAGKHTHGLDRFFSSLYGKLCQGWLLTLSLVSIQQRRSFPIHIEQVVRSDAERRPARPKRTPRSSPSTAQRRPGRPKGSKNTPKAEVPLTPERSSITGMLGALWQVIAGVISLTHLVLDGHFGNHHALQMALQRNLHLICQAAMRCCLYFPYVGPYAGRGPHRKYGSKVDYDHIPGQYLKETTVEGHIQTRLYQAQLLHKGFTQPLNVVILAKTQPAHPGPCPCHPVQQ